MYWDFSVLIKKMRLDRDGITGRFKRKDQAKIMEPRNTAKGTGL